MEFKPLITITWKDCKFMGIFPIENEVHSKHNQKSPGKQSSIGIKYLLCEPKAKRSLTN